MARSKECGIASCPSSACNTIPRPRLVRMMPAIFSPHSRVSSKGTGARRTIDRPAIRANVAPMYSTTDKVPKFMKVAVALAFTAALATSPLALADQHEKADAAATKEVTGEIVDMMCYVDHGAKGEKHQAC